ncbi:MAG: N-acetyl-D-Glu racemase DgcA [Hyphomicrobiaceae bacterium]|nr:N-acetyl-D-Glu racemase DgcA [Hyphomicrobiaceae bacterium]
MTASILAVDIEVWPLAQPFVIARGAKTEARVVVVTVADGPHRGRGEAVPYARYGETPEATRQALLAAATADAATLAATLPPGAARNALDCALWDLDAKRSGIPAAVRAAAMVPWAIPPAPIVTAYTLSLAAPDAMAVAARAARSLPLLKLKLGGGAIDGERMRAVRAARPDARLIADANEAWTLAETPALLSEAAACGFETVEQPLPAEADAALAGMDRPLPVTADESVHVSTDLERLAGRYDAVNIKLDKAGGLTEALRLATAARERGLDIMVGSMVATSLAVAPALLLAGVARWVDLDGPLLLAADRPDGLAIADGIVAPASRRLWG